MPGQDNLQYLTIDDFSPGIISNIRQATGVIVDNKPGTAAEGTVSCYANEAGHLVPLPGHHSALDQTFTITAETTGTARVCGIYTFGPMWGVAGFIHSQNANFKDELHVAWEVAPASGHTYHSFEWHIRQLYYAAIPADSVQISAGLHTNVSGAYRGVSWATSRVNNGGSFGIAGLPTTFTEWTESPEAQNVNTYQFAYPNPTLPGNTLPSTGALMATWTAMYPCQVISHASRVLVLSWVSGYSRGAGSNEYVTNEDILYTDPPGQWTIPNTQQVTNFDLDSPSPIMSWGSIAYGELLLIKQTGGAINLDGDIYAPQVSTIRSMKSVGDLKNPASVTTKGLVYCVENDGAYLWEGGSSSRKINNIGDRFYDRPNGNATSGVKVVHTSWEDMVVFPNGWVWDSGNESWWKLDNADTAVVAAGKGSPHLLWAAPDGITNLANGATTVVRCYDKTFPATAWTWVSQPIKVTDDGSLVDIQEVSISAADIQAGTVIQVTIYRGDSTVVAANSYIWTAASTSPVRLRQPLAASNLPDIRIQLDAISGVANTPAPVVTAIDIGWSPAQPQPQSA